MIGDKLFLIDSNIFIYGIDSSETSKHLIAKNLLKLCWLGKKTYCVSLQNLSEFFVNSTRKVAKPLSKEKGAKIVNKIIEFDGFKKLEPTKGTLKKAMDISVKENIEYWDALIAATMIENNISHIYTENIKDFRIEGITAVNPFEKLEESLKE